MRRYTIPWWLELGRPPGETGQIVQSSYGVDLQLGVAVRHTIDKSDGAESWAICDLTYEELGELEHWCSDRGAPDVAGVWRLVEAIVEEVPR